eukprot:10637746-Lingulodinium_polyedra.AAC.1
MPDQRQLTTDKHNNKGLDRHIPRTQSIEKGHAPNYNTAQPHSQHFWPKGKSPSTTLTNPPGRLGRSCPPRCVPLPITAFFI